MSELTTFSRRKRPGCAPCTVPEDSKSSRDEIKTVRIKQTSRSNLKSSGRRDLEKSVRQKKLVQMFLDVGQKNFFSTTCSECGFVYTPGKNEEERLHMSHHNQALSLNLMKFKKIPQGATLLMDDGTMGKIYKMYYFKNSQGNTKSIMASISDLLQKEMGTCDGWIDSDDAVVYVYLNQNKEMIGCIILEVNPVLAYEASLTASDISKCSSAELRHGIVLGNKEKVKKKKSQCAVRLMWTSHSCRRKKIASKLLDCARAQLISGQIIPRESVAFSQPSHDGGMFIQKYTGSSDFLVYE